jgi:hypothetical protein
MLLVEPREMSISVLGSGEPAGKMLELAGRGREGFADFEQWYVPTGREVVAPLRPLVQERRDEADRRASREESDASR